MRVSTFKAMSGFYKIADIVVTGAGGAGADAVQKVNADGSWGDMYFYMTMDGSGWLEDGWYKADAATPVDDDDILNEGEALFVTAGSGIVFTYIGQVVPGNSSIQAFAGNSMIGNPAPIETRISEIIVTGAGGAGADAVQKVNADGSWGDMYFYMTMDGSGWLEDGWYKADAATPVDDDDILAAGDALFATTASDVTFTFPGAL